MISVVYCTRQPNPEHIEHLIKSSGLHKHLEVIEIINNGESLTKAYNRGLKQAKNDIVVFCHDDITIETKQWGDKLLKLFKRNPEYGILGVAGTKFMSTSGTWWENRRKMYGRVAHTHEGKTWLSSYSDDLGQNIEETVVVDGVFFAIDKNKIRTEFNESVEGFHFYDVTFCFENYLHGVKIGVTTFIRINHKSIGMTNESWEKNRSYFAENFKNNLPIDIPKVRRKGEILKVLVACMSLQNETEFEKYILDLVDYLKKDNCVVTVASNFNKKYETLLKSKGATLSSLMEPPGFKAGDGQWLLKTNNGDVPSTPNVLYKVKDVYFDEIYVAGKPIFEHVNRLYQGTDVHQIIPSINSGIDDPIMESNILSYIPLNDEIRNSLLGVYQISQDKIKTVGLKTEKPAHIKKFDKKTPIKILSGWTNKGGSTFAFIRLVNALNDAGYNATFYGPHDWHLDKCKADKSENLIINPTDIIITHFVQLPQRPNARKVILACHEKNLFEVGKVPQYWDEVVFLNQRHRDYHNQYNGKFSIIPNLRERFVKRDKIGLEKIAGIIGSFDENKQTHISIQRALADGCEKVYLFGEPNTPYYEEYVKPLLSDKVILKGFSSDKQSMYDSIGCVYHSSKSEVACLVKDECESAGVIFNGNDVTNNPPVTLTNDEIIKEWANLLNL